MLTIFPHCAFHQANMAIYGEFATKFWTCRRAVFCGKAYNSLVHFHNKPNAAILKSLVSLVRVSLSVCVRVPPHSIEYIHFACIYDTCCTFFLLSHFQSLSFLAASHFPQCVGVMATACSRAPKHANLESPLEFLLR